MSHDAVRDEESMPCEPALKLGASLRIQDVVAGHRLLERALQGPAPVRIDLGQLIDIDTAGVQLLIACSREAARRGVEVRFVGETPRLIEAFRALGLDGALTGRAGR